MKYFISESKLKNVIFKYLDSRNFHISRHNDGYIFFNSERPGPILISLYPYDSDGYINSDLLTEISSFFDLSLNDSLSIIGDWVHSKTDFRVTYFYSDYGSD